MKFKVLLPVLLGVLVIGFTQFAVAEELEKVAYISINQAEFEQPQSVNKYQEIIINGYVENYSRGQTVTISIISPDGISEEINTFATKKGVVFTIHHITMDSQIGEHQVILEYNGEMVASTTFQMIEKK
ncbi:MAG: hypothetical protein HRU07_09165 [Nitrosopumilus sp.]|nr:hypothetical protein [Nitrosopumilus sp.]NRA06299.1 hypothetical protein [Nitrosopumilus sp.]